MKRVLFIIAIAVGVFGCDIEDQVNPNAPALEDITVNASKTDLNNLVTGILSRMRYDHFIYVTASGTITRELYLFDADPRNTTDLISGTGEKNELDNNSFYTTANWIERYRTIKNCNILIESLPNAETLTEAERNGYSGFAKTMMAQQFLVLYSAYYNSGVRLDVADPDNFGSLVTDTVQVIQFIRDLMDEANAELGSASFAFTLSEGFDGFDDPTTFAQFNRALAARAALYANEMGDVLEHLDASFMDLDGNLSTGPKMVFSTSGGDILNDLYKTPQSNANQIVASDTWIDEAQTGDLRVQSKVAKREKPDVKSGVSAAYETRLYATATSPIDIIRNEELLLIYAEANIGMDNNKALAGINAVRRNAGLTELTGTVTIEDVLIERRYSLWGEAHRMVDLRRTDNLNDNYITLDNIVVDGEAVEQKIFNQFPLPLSEVGN